MSLIRKHVAVLQAWACLALVTFAELRSYAQQYFGVFLCPTVLLVTMCVRAYERGRAAACSSEHLMTFAVFRGTRLRSILLHAQVSSNRVVHGLG